MKPSTVLIITMIIVAIFFGAPFSACAEEDADEEKARVVVTEWLPGSR